MFRFLCVLFSLATIPLWSFTFTPTIPLQPLEVARPGPNGNLQLAVAPNGKAMAVWTNFPNQIELQGAFFDGSRWIALTTSTGVPFVNGTIANGSSPRVEIDASGNATIVYVTVPGVTPQGQIVVQRFNQQARASIEGIRTISDVGTVNASPSLAVTSLGSAVVVWIQVAPYKVRAAAFFNAPGGMRWITSPLVFMPFPGTPNGTYPASFGISDPNQGVAVWIDGQTAAIYSGRFTFP